METSNAKCMFIDSMKVPYELSQHIKGYVFYDLSREKIIHECKFECVLKEIKGSRGWSLIRIDDDHYEDFIGNIMSLNCHTCGGFVLLTSVMGSKTKESALRLFCSCDDELELIHSIFP